MQRVNVFAANQGIHAAFNDGFWHRQLTARPRQVPVPTPEVVAARDILRPFGVDDVALSTVPRFYCEHASSPEAEPEPLANRVEPATTRALENYVLRQLGSTLAHVDEIDGEIKRRDPLAPKEWVDLWITAEVHRPPAGDVRIRNPRPVFAVADLAVEDIYILNTDRFPYLGAAEPQPFETFVGLPWDPFKKTKKADVKAEELLRSHLDAAQLADWDRHHCFYVRSQHNHTYCVNGGWHASVDRLDPITKKTTCSYCIIPNYGNWPNGDVLLSKLLLLKYDEATFLEIANQTTW